MRARELVGWNLRRLRLEKGFSQEALGLSVDMEQSYVGRIERGRENATIETLETLGDMLGVHISEFFVPVPKGAKKPPHLKPGRKLES